VNPPAELARAWRVVCRPAAENVTRTDSPDAKSVPRTPARTTLSAGFELDAAPDPPHAVAATTSAIAAAGKGRRISRSGCQTAPAVGSLRRLINVLRMSRAALALAAVLALGGCGDSQPTIQKKSLSRLVLSDQDLGRPFTKFYGGRQAQLDNQGTNRTDPERFGREAGWVARFNRAGSSSTRGPLVVESRADLFRGSSGAKKDLALYRALLVQGPGSQTHAVKLPQLGDDAIGVTWVQSSTKPLRFFRIAWRDANATASVTLDGFDGKVRVQDAIALARKQQRRLAAAPRS
jgi:hypothetical protein